MTATTGPLRPRHDRRRYPIEVHPCDLCPGDVFGTTGSNFVVVAPVWVRTDMAGGPVGYVVHARPVGSTGRTTEFVLWPGTRERVLGHEAQPDPVALAQAEGAHGMTIG
jgi:hypothetical protein